MKTWGVRLWLGVFVVASILMFVPQANAAPVFNDSTFEARWQRVDKPVEETSTAGRGYTWGPQVIGSGGVTTEQYNGKARSVQYFDKGRMEINNRNANPNDLYYVTTGLIVKELVTGKRQDGDNTFLPLQPSDVQVAGDPNDNGANPLAPTYASFRNVTTFAGNQNGVSAAPGSTITTHIDRAGLVTNSTPPEARLYTAYDSATQHNIADVFDRFNHQAGPVWNGNAYVQDAVFYNNTLYVLGHPVTEAYWTQAIVAGHVQNVLVQLFERRVLTYTPDAPDPYKVEMGNVGQHYYTWRYVRNAQCASPQPAPLTTSSGKFPASFSQYLTASLATGGAPGGGAGNVLAYDLGTSAIYGSPAVSLDQKLAVVGTQDSGVFGIALSPNLSAVCARWNYLPADRSFDAPPLLYKGVAYIGGSTGAIHAIDLATGTAKWVSTDTAPIHSQPITDGTNIYVLTDTGRVQAYRLSDGGKLWQTGLLPTANKPTAHNSGLIWGFDGNIYFGWVDGKVYAYTPAGGLLAGWTPPQLPDPIIASPAFDGTTLFIGTTAGQLFAINNKAQIVANRKFGARANFRYTPAIVGNLIYFATYAQGEDPMVIGVTKDLLNVLFSAPSGSPVTTALAVVDGRIYGGTSGGTVIGINASTASLTVYIPAGSGTTFTHSSPVVANGQIYIGGDTGKFYVVK